MASDMKIRAATVVDKPVWLALRRRVRPAVGDEQHERDWLQMVEQRGRRTALLCVDGQGGLLGMIELSHRDRSDDPGSGPVVSVDALHVEQGEARHDTARRLADAAAGWAQARGCRTLVSDTSVDNQWEQKVYRQLGFEEMARKVVFRKALAAPAPRVATAGPAPGPTPVPVTETVPRDHAPAAQEAGPGWWPGPVRATIIVLGILSFYFTDVFSGDVFVGVVLPIVDVIFVIYLLMLFVGMKYRRRTDAGDRHLELFQTTNESD